MAFLYLGHSPPAHLSILHIEIWSQAPFIHGINMWCVSDDIVWLMSCDQWVFAFTSGIKMHSHFSAGHTLWSDLNMQISYRRSCQICQQNIAPRVKETADANGNIVLICRLSLLFVLLVDLALAGRKRRSLVTFYLWERFLSCECYHTVDLASQLRSNHNASLTALRCALDNQIASWSQCMQ